MQKLIINLLNALGNVSIARCHVNAETVDALVALVDSIYGKVIAKRVKDSFVRQNFGYFCLKNLGNEAFYGDVKLTAKKESKMNDRCPKCWCPQDLGHNQGCPDSLDAASTAQADWERGRRDGFDPFNDDVSYQGTNKSYAFGFRVGKQEINSLADDEAQARC